MKRILCLLIAFSSTFFSISIFYTTENTLSYHSTFQNKVTTVGYSIYASVEEDFLDQDADESALPKISIDYSCQLPKIGNSLIKINHERAFSNPLPFHLQIHNLRI